jgi:DNA polymerase (family 10)
LTGENKNIACKTEEDIYKALDLPYIAPELREDTGEINAALKATLPTLIESKQIQGVFHNHTTYSDGANSLEEMANKAKNLGLKYLGFGDHSQSLTVANGLSPERVKKQIAEIDELNSKMKGFRIFKGIECDILADGSLDYDDEILSLFDYVVGSVHTHFQMTREEMTQRIIKAMNHPAITMLGHLTGRLLLRRDGYAVNQEAVLQEAVKTKTLIEINAHPMRLDLDWIHCKRAKELGVKLVINPDAHSTEDLEYYEYGVSVARRGWLEKDEIFNTLTTIEVEAYFSERRKAFTKKK